MMRSPLPARKPPSSREAMIPPWIIEQIRKKERKEERIQPQIPLEEGPLPGSREKEPQEDDRGVVEIQIFGARCAKPR